jgi:hypothetical protein
MSSRVILNQTETYKYTIKTQNYFIAHPNACCPNGILSSAPSALEHFIVSHNPPITRINPKMGPAGIQKCRNGSA